MLQHYSSAGQTHGKSQRCTFRANQPYFVAANMVVIVTSQSIGLQVRIPQCNRSLWLHALDCNNWNQNTSILNSPLKGQSRVGNPSKTDQTELLKIRFHDPFRRKKNPSSNDVFWKERPCFFGLQKNMFSTLWFGCSIFSPKLTPGQTLRSKLLKGTISKADHFWGSFFLWFPCN